MQLATCRCPGACEVDLIFAQLLHSLDRANVVMWTHLALCLQLPEQMNLLALPWCRNKRQTRDSSGDDDKLCLTNAAGRRTFLIVYGA